MKFSRAVLIAAVVTMPAAAAAGPSEDLVSGMAKCAAVTDNTARLACYDSLAPQLKAVQAQPTPPSPPAETADNRPWYDPGRIFGTSPSQQTRPEQFGGENLAPPPPPPPKPGEVAPPAPPAPPEAIDSITAKVTDSALNPFGRFVVFLDNGQVWKQLEGDTDQAHFSKSGGDTVVISRGMIGSYNLVINDSGVAYKVKRIK